MRRVSILMPARDAAATIGEAARSAQRAGRLWQAQGGAWELVVVDDGSRDGTADRLRAALGEEPRLRLVEGPGAGIVAALERGRAACRGDWLARFDADDLMAPERLIAQARTLAADPALSVIGGGVRLFPEATGGMARYAGWINGLRSHEELMRDLFIESPIAHPAATIRAAAVAELGGYREGPFPEDYDLWLRLWEAGARFANAPEEVLAWRQHPGRLTFRDARYSPEAFRELRAEVLCRARLGAAVAIAGAGRDGKRWSKSLRARGRRIAFWLDLDPRKLGQRIHGAPVHPYTDLPRLLEGDPDPPHILAAVGVAGAREIIREALRGAGLVETRGFTCVA